jgi:hypothetical protein
MSDKINLRKFIRFTDIKKNKIINKVINHDSNILLNFIKISRKKLYKKYNCTQTKYDTKILKKLITKSNTHILSVFKDQLIYGNIEEYLKRTYKINEARERLPVFYFCYNEYLHFYVNPIICEFKVNKILLKYYEEKGRIYFKEYYKKNDSKNELKEKMNIEIIFSNSIKKKIETISNNNSISYIDTGIDDNIIESNKSTIRNLINDFNKKDYFQKIYKSYLNKKPDYYQKKNKEKKIKNAIKGKISVSINNKSKDISHQINNYQYKKKENSNSKSKTNSKSNLFNNKSLSKNKEKSLFRSISKINKKSFIRNKGAIKKSRNFSSLYNLTKDTSNIKLEKTSNFSRNVDNNLTKINNFSSFDNKAFCNKIFESENKNETNNFDKTLKPNFKIIKRNLKNNFSFYSKRSLLSNFSMTQNSLKLIIENNKFLYGIKKKKEHCCSTIEINKRENNKQFLKNNLKQSINNENILMNIKSNLNHLNRNSKSLINKKNDKIITNYHSKNFKTQNSKILKNTLSISLNKKNSKNKNKIKISKKYISNNNKYSNNSSSIFLKAFIAIIISASWTIPSIDIFHQELSLTNFTNK